MSEFVTIQMRVAEATASIDAAGLMIHRDIRDTLSIIESGKPADVNLRMRNRLTHSFATKLLVQAVDALFLAAGGSALGLQHPVQRFWRDIHAVSSHISLNWDSVCAMYGQHVFGLRAKRSILSKKGGSYHEERRHRGSVDVCTLRAAANAQQFTLKISSPTINDVSQEWAKVLTAGVEARVDDRIKVEFYPANQLGQIPATVEGIAMGTIEAVVPASGFFIGLEPRFQVFDAPGLFNDMAHAQRVFADPEVRARLATSAAQRACRWSHRAARSAHARVAQADPDDRRLQGSEDPRAGRGTPADRPFKKLGAAPVSMPLGEVLSAMQNRTIDGLIATATVFTAFKYYDVAKGMTALPGSYLVVAVMGNSNFLKSLGPELEKAVREEAFKAQRKVEKFAIEDAARTADVWKKNGGEVIVLPDAERKPT